ncbi:hypothetical protein ACHAWC_004615 [Mediolabrus comicus]
MVLELLPPSPLLPLLFAIFAIHSSRHVTFASAEEEESIKCASGWTSAIQIITSDKINDGYCDCPLDGLDEIKTGACSGSMDGMWAGIAAPSTDSSNDDDKGAASLLFVCPRQPSLRLHPSRINDGICDCCDGADEQYGDGTSCPDICNTVLAAEREARKRLEQDYEIGSQARTSSITQFGKWYDDMQIKIQQLSNEEIKTLEQKVTDANSSLNNQRRELVKEWTLAVENVLNQVTLREIVTNSQYQMDVQDLSLFILSLCQLSGEVSVKQSLFGRCLPFERASLDIGILWDGSNDDGATLPTYHIFDAGNEESITGYADQLIRRLEGKDNIYDQAKKKGSYSDNNRAEPDDDVFDYDDTDHDYHYDHDDEYPEHSEDLIDEPDSKDNGTKEKGDESDNVLTTGSLLEKLPLLAVRNAFKEHGKSLLASSETNEKDENDTEEDAVAASEEEQSDVDPMALSMVRSTISRRLGNIVRGENSSKHAARYISSLVEKSSSVLDDLQSLAIMTVYHSNLSVEDIAEIIYTLSFPSEQLEDGSKQTCSGVMPWSNWCPPADKTVSPKGGTFYQPPLIVTAASSICTTREDDAAGVCSGQEEESEFPTSIPDGYYGYYEPRARSPDEALSPLFAAMDSLRVPEALTGAKKEVEVLETKLASSRKKLADMKADVANSGASKYGVDGELFIMRDTCHKIESGKYEYEVCIFGKATQRDIGQKSGGTNLGSWDKVLTDDNGQRTLLWHKGTKCWNGPMRSAEVVVTCGRLTKILTADEPETCRYVFTMESPIACDEKFKVSNSL